MDYWPRLQLTIHDDSAAFLTAMTGTRLWWFTSKAHQSLWQAVPRDRDCLVFGNETHGLPESILAQHPDQCIRIPQMPGERCLNLSTAVGIGLYDALRQVHRIPK